MASLPSWHPAVSSDSVSECPFSSSSSSASSASLSRSTSASSVDSTTEDDKKGLEGLPGITLQVSSHLVNLPPDHPHTLDPTSSALVRSFQSPTSAFLPTSLDYASLPIQTAFNWSTAFDLDPALPSRTWYGVVFRSRRRVLPDDRDEERARISAQLYLADAFAHEEAVKSGSLLFYWFGSPQPSTTSPSSSLSSVVGGGGGENLATCLWTSEVAAREATKGPKHKEAVKMVAKAYESYRLERYVVRKRRGVAGVTVEPYDGQWIGSGEEPSHDLAK